MFWSRRVQHYSRCSGVLTCCSFASEIVAASEDRATPARPDAEMLGAQHIGAAGGLPPEYRQSNAIFALLDTSDSARNGTAATPTMLGGTPDCCRCGLARSASVSSQNEIDTREWYTSQRNVSHADSHGGQKLIESLHRDIAASRSFERSRTDQSTVILAAPFASTFEAAGGPRRVNKRSGPVRGKRLKSRARKCPICKRLCKLGEKLLLKMAVRYVWGFLKGYFDL